MEYYLANELLTEEELAVYRRARNHKSQSRSKNSGIGDYRRATGFEAVLGYLHYQNKEERLKALMEAGLSFLLEREEGK